MGPIDNIRHQQHQTAGDGEQNNLCRSDGNGTKADGKPQLIKGFKRLPVGTEEDNQHIHNDIGKALCRNQRGYTGGVFLAQRLNADLVHQHFQQAVGDHGKQNAQPGVDTMMDEKQCKHGAAGINGTMSKVHDSQDTENQRVTAGYQRVDKSQYDPVDDIH